MKARHSDLVRDVPFEEASDVTAIPCRLHPLDVGFDLRAEGVAIALPAGEVLRVSYADEGGERRVMSGPREAIRRRLQRLGYRLKETL